ncbi:MAG: hypothetical protein C0524_20325, partial [Rhodobacter sp.]|nr:hypothetical protein [Rhodobacter sp.]
ATITYHPRVAMGRDRINARAAAENIAAERAQAIADCKRIIDDPRGYTDAQLREVCGFYMTHGNGGDHYLRADAHIFAINKREFIARNCPRPEPVISEPAKQLAALVIGGLVAVALAVWGL